LASALKESGFTTHSRRLESILNGTWNALVGLVRCYRGDGPFRPFALVVNLVAMTFLVAFPLVHILRAMPTSRDAAPRILAGFGEWQGTEGYPRLSPHRGLDIKGRVGADALAAADGRVTVARDNRDLCGLIVVIDHDEEQAVFGCLEGDYLRGMVGVMLRK
jgi:murein DD-endopeptidase MepM/ murein hydrolase activator NlpD